MISSVAIALSLPAKGASPQNLLYANPPQTTTLPLGTIFNITIKVANFEAFNGWDVHVRVNSSIIDPLNLTIMGNILSANATTGSPTELANCVNGSTSTCPNDPYVGPGIVRSAVALLGGTVAGDGLLFTIYYKVVGVGFSQISMIDDVISNGSGSSVLHSTSSATYGAQIVEPDFGIGTSPTALVITKAVSHSVSQNATITLTSIDGFSGNASLTASASLSVSFYPLYIFLHANSDNSSTITVSASNSTTSTQYFVNVTATVGSRAHWQILPVQVKPIPDFIFSVTPSILKIHATGSGSSIVTIDTQSGYSGPVNLALAYPNVPGLAASLGSSNFAISPGEPATTVFNVRTPDSGFPFVYLINITASGQAPKHAPFTITVKSPSPNFDLQISSSGYAIQAGKSRTFTLTMTSLDYFKGQLFLLATSFSGIETTFTRPAVALDYGNSSTSMITITTDANLAPGNHNVTITELGTSFLNVSTNHTITMTITVTPPQYQTTILGVEPPVYFSVIGVLWIAVIGAAVLEIRKPKAKRFLS